MNQLIDRSANQPISSLQSPSTSTRYSLHHLPREIIHAIVGDDMRIYNALTRTCHALAAAYTLSTRLDFMIAAGVTVQLYTSLSGPMINWSLCGQPHDVFGPTYTWLNGNRAYMRRGWFHRCDGPAWIHRSEHEDVITWYQDRMAHRDVNEPAATGVELLRGVASIGIRDGVVIITWYTKGRATRTLMGPEYMTTAQAEIDYWRAH